MASRIFERIPSVSELLEAPALKSVMDRVNHHVVVTEVRNFLDKLRDEIRTRSEDFTIPTPSEIADRVADWISREERPRLRSVVNATGIVLHTGLGRAPLSDLALDAMATMGRDYMSLEVDIESGERSQRVAAVERLLAETTGAEAAVVVNNCAAATVLTLGSLAPGREVVVSRGELIEIGGSYRLPEIMAVSGAVLREIGTTNKTRRTDYEAACNPMTAALLKVHTSNYRIVGFAEAPSLSDIVAVGRARQIPVVHDLGSGALVDLKKYGIADEPTVKESQQAGADLILFSGDKLLGGPQCGIVVGKRALVSKLLKHPLMRAFRVDKLTLVALHATLLLYRRLEEAEEKIPILSLLSTSLQNLQLRAERLAPQLAASSAVKVAEPVPCESQLGGGSTPAVGIPSFALRIEPAEGTVDTLAARLRRGHPSVFGRIHRDALWLDLRTVFPRQDALIVEAFAAVSRSAP